MHACHGTRQEACFHLNVFRGCNPWSPEEERRKVKDVVIHTWFKYVEPPQANEVRLDVPLNRAFAPLASTSSSEALQRQRHGDTGVAWCTDHLHEDASQIFCDFFRPVVHSACVSPANRASRRLSACRLRCGISGSREKAGLSASLYSCTSSPSEGESIIISASI